MLQHLVIRDLAVVSFADIAFSEGMTVITGETGAGKSILLDALNLALGERADSHWVRPGAEKAEIAATFDITTLSGAVLWLAELELTCDDTPQTCIIRRILYANGRSKAFINGRPATTQQLRLLGDYLVQIHGQHQHQLLLKTSEQLRLLDAFGQHDELLSKVKTAYKHWETLHQRLQKLKAQGTPEQSRLDLLQYQISELEALNLQPNELTALHAEHDQLANAQEYIQASESVLNLLEAGDQGNALQFISQAQLALRSLTDKYPTLANVNECLNNAHIQLEEAASEVNDFIAKLEINPERLNAVSMRLAQIHDMARKHKIDPTLLETHTQKLKTEALNYADVEQAIKQLEQDLHIGAKHYQIVAKSLSQARFEASEKLSVEVSQIIAELGMKGGTFTVALNPHVDETLHLTGNETALFCFSANPGHAPLPLNKVASGGELSRISLALELVAAKFLATPCLVFDEVDVGISGKTGSIVGKALYDLSQSAQVLCVTHLPQVAAMGDHHIQVTKTPLKDSTQSNITLLTEKQRIEEIARMLGGLDVSAQARANAKQLLQQKLEVSPT
ncbi:MAG: DNA repair protein RecN [Proteobacteria bacterium]|nr:DNA repair protein RecN [Pseudomonadota bacterium]